MATTPNSIRSLSTIQSLKASILSANSTSKAASATKATLPAALTNLELNTPIPSEHIEKTNVHTLNDCLLRLGDGDCKFLFAQKNVLPPKNAIFFQLKWFGKRWSKNLFVEMKPSSNIFSM